MLSFVRPLATFASIRFSALASFKVACRLTLARISSTSMREYHMSRFPMAANARMFSRYERPTSWLIAARCFSSKPRSRPATAKLAASRFTSHSNGPGSVSSKSLRLKTILRSGAAKPPKFDRWASPQSWVCSPVRGPLAERSDAIRYAAPR